MHIRSTAKTRERAVGGVVTGLIGPGQEVTWEATHFGVRQRLTVRITAFERPWDFRDSQVRGAFARFDHDHFFEEQNGSTIMRDVLDFAAPLGVLGRLADVLFLRAYMQRFLVARAAVIKAAAEELQAKPTI